MRRYTFPNSGRPFTPFDLQRALQDAISYYTHELVGVIQPPQKALIGVRLNLQDYTANDNERYAIMGRILGLRQPIHSRDLTAPQIFALRDWIGSSEVDGLWLPHPYFIQEIQAVIAELNQLASAGTPYPLFSLPQPDGWLESSYEDRNGSGNSDNDYCNF